MSTEQAEAVEMVKLYRWAPTGAWHLESQYGSMLVQGATCKEVMAWAARALNIQDWTYGTQRMFFVSHTADRGTFIGVMRSPRDAQQDAAVSA